MPGTLFSRGTPASDLVWCLETVEQGRARLATGEEIALRLDGMPRDGVVIIACGHTHIPRSVRLADGTLVVNPGSVGLQAYSGDSPELHPMETGSPDARYAILERLAAGWRTELVAVPYDAREMARLAAERGRPEWEHALRTGCVPRPSAPRQGVRSARRPRAVLRGHPVLA